MEIQTRGKPASSGDGSAALRWTVVLVLVLWSVVALPLVSAQRTLFYRDVFTIHLPLKAFGAQELRQGRIPAFNPSWGLGQPFRGNPNALPFYPGNLFYLVLPFWSAFNLHYVLHWLLAAFAMWHLAREVGQSREGAFLAALTYAGSGFVLSCLTFYNLLTVAAWWPLVLVGGSRGGHRGIALGGLACGLALLGGEPITAVLGLVPLIVLAAGRHGLRRGLGTVFLIGLLGLVVALPQVVATARIVTSTFRGGHGIPASEAAGYAFSLIRLLELLVPFPFGRPGHFGPDGFWVAAVSPKTPFIFTIHTGAVGLLAVILGWQRRWPWWTLAGGGLLVAWLGGQAPEILSRLGAGVFRFPEKFLLWPALALPLLAGWGLGDGLARPGRLRRVALGGALLCAGLACGGWLFSRTLVTWLGGQLAVGAPFQTAETLHRSWLLALGVSSLVLVLAAWFGSRRWAVGVVILQAVALLQLHPLLFQDSSEPYRTSPPWAQEVERGSRVFNPALATPAWDPMPPYLFDPSLEVRNRWLAQDLDAAPGVLHGLEYPLGADFEGLSFSLYTLMLRQLPHLDLRGKRNWLRSQGVEIVVANRDPEIEGLREIGRARRPGPSLGLYRVPDPAPQAWWPEGLVQAAHPLEALRLVSEAEDPIAQVVVPGSIPHHPGGEVEVISLAPDRVELRVRSQGGVVVLRRAYQTLWQARSRAEELAVVPANLNLLAVVVPPGDRRVVLSVSSWPEAVAGGIALVAAILLVLVAWRGSSGPSWLGARSEQSSPRPTG